MGVSKPVFTCIRTKAVDNADRWVSKRSDMSYIVYKKIDDLKDYCIHFFFVSTSDT